MNRLDNNWFPPSLRSVGNAALSGLCLCPCSARAGNQAQEQDALRAPLSAALDCYAKHIEAVLNSENPNLNGEVT